MNDMSEKDPLLSSPPHASDNQFTKFVHQYQRVEDGIKAHHRTAIRRIHAREFLAEFLATFILVTFGNGAIAQFILSKQANGTFLTVNIGYGIGLMMGAYVAGGVTGAHMNPAVTLAMALRGKTAWIKVVPYWIAQFLGAFLSSAVVYGVYVGIFATYPEDHLSFANGFLDQAFGTFLLVLGIFAICDSQNSEVKAGLKPLMIGFLLWGIGGSFGFNAGYAINPARDFAPRLFTAMAGWGSDAFKCSQCLISLWWLIPVIAPMVGAVIATPVYWLVMEANHPPLHDDEHVGTVQGRRTIPPRLNYET